MNILTKYLGRLCKFAFIALAIGALSLTAYAGAEDTSRSTASLDLSLQSSENEALQSLLPEVLPCSDNVVSATGGVEQSPSYQEDSLCYTACWCCDSSGRQDCCTYCETNCNGGNKSVFISTDAT